MEPGVRRITSTRLIDHDGRIREGDFLLLEDGSYSPSSGDEDVKETVDGRDLAVSYTHLTLPTTVQV